MYGPPWQTAVHIQTRPRSAPVTFNPEGKGRQPALILNWSYLETLVSMNNKKTPSTQDAPDGRTCERSGDDDE